MKQVKIISDPYKKETSFQIFDENQKNWINIDKLSNPNSKLISDDFKSSFFPFKIQEIVETIIKEYGIGDNQLDIYFKGTPDHFDDLQQIIETIDVSCKLTLFRDDSYLINAQDVLPEIINIFKKLKPIIELGEDNKEKLKKYIERFSDSSADRIPLCVIGNYSSGKSTFINALIGKEILPSGDDPVTAKVFKINQLENDNSTYIKFEYDGNDVQILINDKNFEVLGQTSSFEQELKEILKENIEDGNVKTINACIAYINKTDYTRISSIIEIGTSFKGGIWNECSSRFIIIDTPGSNSATNLNHSEVLDKALKGLTNGLPLYVSEANKLDSTDNFDLYKKVKDMPEIDSRFTMIIVNKADDSDLPEEGYYTEENEIALLNQAIPKSMYSIGIYFVSSIMGLGAKCNGDFANKHSRKIHRKNLDMFSDIEDEDYTCLYNFNIMPRQIKTNSIEKCKSIMNDLVYVNSGLYAIEHGIQNFANKYSAYNKCKQSLMYLEKIIKLIDSEIKKLVSESEKKKKELIESLNEEKANLLDTIEKTSRDRKSEFVEEGRVFLRQYTQENKPSISHNELVSYEEEFIKKQRRNIKYSFYQEQVKDSKRSFVNNLKSGFGDTIQNLSFDIISNAVSTAISDGKNIIESYYDRNKAEKDADKLAAKDIIDKIDKDLTINSDEFFSKTNEASIQYWDDKSSEVRKELSKIVLGSTALSESKKNELTELIMNYDAIEYNVIHDNILKVEDYKFRFFSEKLIKIKLSIDVNKLYDSFAKYTNNTIYESHSLSFKRWMDQLSHIITENIVDYNPLLSELQKAINAEIDKIHELQYRQEVVESNIAYIRKKIDWQTNE